MPGNELIYYTPPDKTIGSRVIEQAGYFNPEVSEVFTRDCTDEELWAHMLGKTTVKKDNIVYNIRNFLTIKLVTE